ncbi:FAD-dependent oxidoreductase [Parasphingopyxis sp.]|uniref:FAD-dependent oxidoreductase n=1 Tax=Parasphingopyxis sp. TaxID=1920299 RepID=UPI00262EED16|nr:FAD-dependent oxidoreductase [Parasphingopyxis sp.]
MIRTIAGLRPYRPSGYRVETQPLDGKTIVHNYGHGGAGISLCWGSSREAIALGLPGHAGPVAVIGAGALGLTTARLLQEAGFPVRIYAKALPPNTTSNIAGGQIMPGSYYDRGAVTQNWLARRVLATDFTRRRMQIMVGDDYGVRWLPTYDEGRLRSAAPNPVFPDRQALPYNAHPFPAENMLRYRTMYVQTGRFLASLMRDIRIAGGTIVVRDFATPSEVLALPERLVFNCTGLGARALFGDEELEPVRGQLAVLIPQPEIDYAYTVRQGYMFPRPDGIVLGGTFEHGEWTAEPQPEDIARIVERHRGLAESWRCGAEA